MQYFIFEMKPYTFLKYITLYMRSNSSWIHSHADLPPATWTSASHNEGPGACVRAFSNIPACCISKLCRSAIISRSMNRCQTVQRRALVNLRIAQTSSCLYGTSRTPSCLYATSWYIKLLLRYFSDIKLLVRFFTDIKLLARYFTDEV